MASIRKKREDFETESAWRTYELTHPEKKDEEEEFEYESEVTIYYVCKNPKCDFIKKQTVSVTPSQLKEIEDMLPKGKCPNCGSNGFKKLSKEEYEKELKRIEKLKKNSEEEKNKEFKEEATSEAKLVLKDALDDIKDLYEDLRIKLKRNDITPKCFVTLFYNISFDIMNSVNKSYRKKYYAGLIDLNKERKTILDMGQIILDLYNIEEEQIDIIENYDKETDENYQVIYNVYNSKYELDRNEEFEDYKRETRLENYIKDIERKRKLQENQINKVMDKSQKRADKLQNKEEKSFADSLSGYVKKIDKM